VAAINHPPTAVDDVFQVAAASANNPLNPVGNDSTAPDTGEMLRIIAVSAGNHGGQVSIGTDQQTVSYTPPANFSGTETFTYTVSDGSLTTTATVTVHVTPPLVVPVPVNSGPITVDVPTTTPADTGGGTIVSVTPPSSGGTVAVSGDGTHFIYIPPPGFTGIETAILAQTNGSGALVYRAVTFSVGIRSAPSSGVSLDETTLDIIGSAQRDNISLTISHGKLVVVGTLGTERVKQSFPLGAVSQIVADLGDGNDQLAIAANVRAPLFVDAGAGNDWIQAGGGSSVISGGDGDDMLVGGGRRDVLIGGSGRDLLMGGGGSDILIGGSTSSDHSQSALLAIQQEWNSSRSFADRVTNLRTGSGPILPAMGIALQPGQQGFSDAAADLLFGGSDLNWLLGPAAPKQAGHHMAKW